MIQPPLRDEAFWQALQARLEQPLSRRDFAHLLAASAALAGVNCSVGPPPGDALPYAQTDPRNRPGIPTHYATTLWHGMVGVGVVATTREGRTIKIEGNPHHPSSLGATTPWEQASVLQLYDPDRLRTVTRGGAAYTWDAANHALRQRLGDAGDGVAVLWEPRCSPYGVEQLRRLQQRYPKAQVYSHAPILHHHAARAGALLATGTEGEPMWRLNQAKFAVVLEADILGVFADGLPLARQWADAHGAGTALWCVESGVTLTGLKADRRWASPANRTVYLAAAVLTGLLNAQGLDPQDGLGLTADERALVRDARARWQRQPGVVIPGPSMPPAIHAAAALVNNTTCPWRAPLLPAGWRGESLLDFCDAVKSRAVHTVVFLGGNPVYTAPPHCPVEAFAGVQETFYVGMHRNETAQRCTWVLPEAHPLVAWGDAQAHDGTVSFQQPTMTPLDEGRAWGDVLAQWVNPEAPQGRSALAAFWRERGCDGDAMDAALAEGVQHGTAAATWTVQPTAERRALVVQHLAQLQQPMAEPGTYTVTLSPDARVGDGARGNNPWLQELPDPVTGLAWGNAAHMNPTDAAALGLVTGDMVILRVGDVTVEAPVLVLPQHAAGAITVSLGYGRSGDEHVAAGIGFNAFPLQSAHTPGFTAGVQVHATGRKAPLAFAQEPRTWAGAPPLETGPETPPSGLPPLHDPRAHSATPQWAMAIDLDRCTGCHACVIACQAENNIPVVGRDNVIRGRSMHWLRIDRYLGEHSTLQPMLCQHCEHAPCEYVCPVGATQHSPDGLNEMVYNRCVGTRFCANNCPYKVRRFNWFAFHADASPTERLSHNPEVTVRGRGVMEKCTFCVQRIRAAARTARREQRALLDHDVVTACQQVCPTQAITFGDLLHPHGAVGRAFHDARAQVALAHLGTRPRVRYLKPREKVP